MTKLISALCLLVSVGAFAARYPVDEEIDGLRGKAEHLENIKLLLEKNDCFIQVDKNVVKLVPGALRSEGLVMAIGEKFPGRYLAYHKAPKPEHLDGVIDLAMLSHDAHKGAVLVTLSLAVNPKTGIRNVIFLKVGQPKPADESGDLWIYDMRQVGALVPTNNSKIVKEFEGPAKQKVVLRCN